METTLPSGFTLTQLSADVAGSTSRAARNGCPVGELVAEYTPGCPTYYFGRAAGRTVAHGENLNAVLVELADAVLAERAGGVK